MSRESDLTQLWLKWVESELSQVRKFVVWVESELSQSRKVKCWVESELSQLDCQMSQSRVSLKIWVEHSRNPGRESNLTRLWLKWVESELSRLWKSGIWVESESNHADRHLSQRWINSILLESMLSHWFFWRENVKILHLSVTLPGKKQPTTTFNRPPPPGQQLLAKLGKMWWVVSQSWVRLANLGFELSRCCQSRKVKCWVEWELSHLYCHMSQSRVSPKKLSRAQPCYLHTSFARCIAWYMRVPLNCAVYPIVQYIMIPVLMPLIFAPNTHCVRMVVHTYVNVLSQSILPCKL